MQKQFVSNQSNW